MPQVVLSNAGVSAAALDTVPVALGGVSAAGLEAEAAGARDR